MSKHPSKTKEEIDLITHKKFLTKLKNQEIRDSLDELIKNYSVTESLRVQGKSDPDFEAKVSRLTLEELLALKLESTYRVLGHTCFGMKLYDSLELITKDAILRVALSINLKMTDASQFLGFSRTRDFIRELMKFGFRHGTTSKYVEINRIRDPYFDILKKSTEIYDERVKYPYLQHEEKVRNKKIL